MNIEEANFIKQLVLNHKRRLKKQQLRAAWEGKHCPPEIIMEIEDIQETISSLETQLDKNNIQFNQAKNMAGQIGRNVESIDEHLNIVTEKQEKTYKLFGIPVWTVTVVITKILIFVVAMLLSVSLMFFIVPNFTVSPLPNEVNPLLNGVTTEITVEDSTFVQEGFPSTSGSNSRFFSIGYDPEGSGRSRTRSLLKFKDTSIPKNLNIEKAVVFVYQHFVPLTEAKTGPIKVQVYNVTSDWYSNSVNTTWENQPQVGELVGTALFTRTIGWQSVDITPLVKEWQSGTEDHGIALMLEDELMRGAYYCSIFALEAQCGSSGVYPPHLSLQFSSP